MRKPQTTGVAIRKARQARGWSQAELAESIGVTQPTVSNWECDRMMPRAGMAIAIAEMLGLDEWRGFRRLFKLSA